MDYFADLKFVRFGSNRKNKKMELNRYFDGYYGLQFIRSGEIVVDCEGEKQWQGSGPLVFFTAPGKRFTYYTPNGCRNHLFICFSGERVKRYLAGGLMPQTCGQKIPITAANELTALLEELLRTLLRNAPRSHGKAVLLLEQALLAVANQPETIHKRRFDCSEIHQLTEQITEHPEKEWNFREIAEKSHISEVHFRRLFVQETGLAPHHYVLTQRVRAAAVLLQSSNMRIKEIAYECGFGGEFYFSRQFRKIMNMSPRDYRKNN